MEVMYIYIYILHKQNTPSIGFSSSKKQIVVLQEIMDGPMLTLVRDGMREMFRGGMI